jgi:hypothetical protein
MAFEHKPNTGSIFKNTYKTEDKHPDHQGACKVTCEKCGHDTELKISAWINLQRDNVTRYFGLRFSKHQPKEQSTPVQEHPDLDDDIPF